MEGAPTKINVKFENCESNYNIDLTSSDEYFCSGFMVSGPGTSLTNCVANYNTNYGFRTSGGGAVTFTGCTGTGNEKGLFGSG
jgi:hypothetical protein